MVSVAGLKARTCHGRRALATLLLRQGVMRKRVLRVVFVHGALCARGLDVARFHALEIATAMLGDHTHDTEETGNPALVLVRSLRGRGLVNGLPMLPHVYLFISSCTVLLLSALPSETMALMHGGPTNCSRP